MDNLIIRPLQPEDDLVLLTDLIRAAYAPHAANGLSYWATRQSPADTAKRFAGGQGLVAMADGQFAGTITLRGPKPDSPVALYRAGDTWSFGQFAVAPAHKGRGIGAALHQHALACAMAKGARVMALDTAAGADALIALYRAWGYEICGQCDWRPQTNYLSVLMARALAA